MNLCNVMCLLQPRMRLKAISGFYHTETFLFKVKYFLPFKIWHVCGAAYQMHLGRNVMFSRVRMANKSRCCANDIAWQQKSLHYSYTMVMIKPMYCKEKSTSTFIKALLNKKVFNIYSIFQNLVFCTSSSKIF